MNTFEIIIVVAVVGLAVVFVVRSFLKTAKGDGACACGDDKEKCPAAEICDTTKIKKAQKARKAEKTRDQ